MEKRESSRDENRIWRETKRVKDRDILNKQKNERKIER